MESHLRMIVSHAATNCIHEAFEELYIAESLPMSFLIGYTEQKR
jgi:hypothetical protein